MDRGKSFLMFGDLRQEDGPQGMPVGSYGSLQRNLTGVRLHWEGRKGIRLTLNGAQPDTAFAREIVPGSNFGLVRLSHMNLLVGSETVVIEVRDRRNPGEVLSRETLVRNVDYDLEYLSGGLFLQRSFS